MEKSRSHKNNDGEIYLENGQERLLRPLQGPTIVISPASSSSEPPLKISTDSTGLARNNLFKQDFAVTSTDNNSSLSRRGLLRQVRAAGAADLSSLGVGLVLGYSAVALPQLTAEDSWLPLDEDQASWFASLPGITLSLGCLLSGVLMERFGRRATIQLQCAPSALGWVLIASARGVPQLYAGRLLTGLGGGMVDAACQVYIGEISSPSVRGAIGASSSLCFSMGVLVVYVLGWARVPWSLLAGLCCAVPVLAFVALCFVPESPIWLQTRGRSKKATNAFRWLLGVEGEQNGETQDLHLEELPSAPPLSGREVLRSLASRHTARPLAILLGFFFFQQFCGMNAVVFYAVNMFSGKDEEGGGGGLDSHQSAVLIGLTRFVMTGVTCALLARVGRRPLCLISGGGMAASMLTLGTALYVMHPSPAPALVLPCLAAFIASNTVGFFAVPWVMLGELLPERSRGATSGLAAATAYSFVFVVVKTYPLLLEAVGQAGVFWTYGAISLIGTLFVLALLPETKGRTLQEIESSLRRRPRIYT